jgi:hypothetical protein
LRELPRTMSELLVGSGGNPFPGRSLARFWSADSRAAPDPVLSQLEEPSLTGEDFGVDPAVRINSVIDEAHILIDYGSKYLELYAIEDRKQERNLADHPAQRLRLERLQRTLAALRQGAHPL